MLEREPMDRPTDGGDVAARARGTSSIDEGFARGRRGAGSRRVGASAGARAPSRQCDLRGERRQLGGVAADGARGREGDADADRRRSARARLGAAAVVPSPPRPSTTGHRVQGRGAARDALRGRPCRELVRERLDADAGSRRRCDGRPHRRRRAAGVGLHSAGRARRCAPRDGCTGRARRRVRERASLARVALESRWRKPNDSSARRPSARSS